MDLGEIFCFYLWENFFVFFMVDCLVMINNRLWNGIFVYYLSSFWVIIDVFLGLFVNGFSRIVIMSVVIFCLGELFVFNSMLGV